MTDKEIFRSILDDQNIRMNGCGEREGKPQKLKLHSLYHVSMNSETQVPYLVGS